MTYALGTSRGRITKAPLLLIDVETEEGVTGRAYLWSYFPRAMVGDREPAAARSRSAPRASASCRPTLWDKLAERFALIGVQGIVRMAMAGFDIACWDALAVAAGVPLVRLLGGEPRRDPGLQFLRARPDADRRARRRGREAARARLPRHQAAARLSDAGRGPRRGARRQGAHAGRRRADGRLQPGARRRRGAGARPRARPREHRLARGADPPRRLCRRRAARPRAGDADPDRREFLAGRRNAGGAQRQGLRSGDARSRTHRRRHRLAAGGGACRRSARSRCHRISIRRPARICSR